MLRGSFALPLSRPGCHSRSASQEPPAPYRGGQRLKNRFLRVDKTLRKLIVSLKIRRSAPGGGTVTRSGTAAAHASVRGARK